MYASCAAGSDYRCCGCTDSRRKPSAVSCLACAAFVQNGAELRRDAVLQVTAPPAHYAVPNRVGTGLNPRSKRGHLLGPQPPGSLRHRSVHQSGDAPGILAVPVRLGKCPPDSFLTLFTPQRLAIRPADLCRRRAVNPSSTSAITSIRRAARASFDLPCATPLPSAPSARSKSLPCPPSAREAALRQRLPASGIPKESGAKAVGIFFFFD